MHKHVSLGLAALLIGLLLLFGCSARQHSQPTPVVDFTQATAVPSNPPSPTPTPTPLLTPSPVPTLNPDANVSPFTWNHSTPLMEYTQYAYERSAQPLPFDIQQIIRTIWGDAQYETSQLGEQPLFSLLPYSSQYGKFREHLTLTPNGLFYYWESNEHTRRETKMKLTPEQGYEKAKAYVDEFFGTDEFTRFPADIVLPTDENGDPADWFFEFRWENQLNGISLSHDSVRVRLNNNGIPSLSLNWGYYTPVQAPIAPALDFEQALHALNVTRSNLSVSGACVEVGEESTLVGVRLVYTPCFADPTAHNRLTLAWEFTLAQPNNAQSSKAYIDIATGDFYNEHDGSIQY